MTTIDKIEKGVANYLDAELIPQFQDNKFEKVLVGTAASLLIRKTGAIIEGYKDNNFVKMLGIMDDKGNVNVEIIAEELKKNISEQGFEIDIPIIGTLTFHKEDVDKLCDYIMV